MNRDDLCRRATAVRALALEAVLLLRGAVRDRHDRSKWHTEQGPVSISGAKFMNWRRGHGGGGAIDLVMHLAEADFRTAVAWLEQHFGGDALAVGEAATHSGVVAERLERIAQQPFAASAGQATTHARRKNPSVPETHSEARSTLRLPVPNDRLLDRVRQYLTRRRHLAASLIEALVESGTLYADHRGNAVFLLLAGKAQRPVGAELRGTGPQVWRGMSPGTRKDLGYFWIGAMKRSGSTPEAGDAQEIVLCEVFGGREDKHRRLEASDAQEIVLCESAIDAISCHQMHPERICISTSGVRAHPRWLSSLIARGHDIHCGFDADNAGDTAAAQMIAAHPLVQRLRPPAHDWNDALTSRP
jgi:hypothetical protein